MMRNLNQETSRSLRPEASGYARPKTKQNWAPGDNDRLVSHSTSNGLPLTQLTNGWVVGSCEQVERPCRWLEQGIAHIHKYLITIN